MTGEDLQELVDRIAAAGTERSPHALGLAAGVPAVVASIIDHTLLRPDASSGDIATLCAEAVRHAFATVCVNPVWVPYASGLLAGSVVRVCTVVGFPLGATTPDVKRYETQRAMAGGASEVDMVIDIGALKSGDMNAVARDLDAVIVPARAGGVLTKVIIEAALLTDEEKVVVCTLAREAGADYVKTSTGFGPGGATVADVALMRRAVGPGVGVKAAGGIRDLDAFRAMVMAGATRVGTSAGVRIVREAEEARSKGKPVL